jgi:hypothetical protein
MAINPFTQLMILKKLRDQQMAAQGLNNQEPKPVKFSWGKKCPKCDGQNLNKVKPSLMKKATRGSAFLLFGPLALAMKDPKTLNVCRDCGFSWEDR